MNFLNKVYTKTVELVAIFSYHIL